MIVLVDYNTLKVEQVFNENNFDLNVFLKSKVASSYLELRGIIHRPEGFFLDISKNPTYDYWFENFKVTNQYKRYARLYKLQQLQKS